MKTTGHTQRSSNRTQIIKARTKMQPILKKLSNEKSSLVLARPWGDRAMDGLSRAEHSASACDVSFASGLPIGFAAGTDQSMCGIGVGSVGAHSCSPGSDTASAGDRYKLHVRSISSGSGSNLRAFVHPFQQTPRTSTPPLSYANSRTSFENSSPTITEAEDCEPVYQYPAQSSSSRPHSNLRSQPAPQTLQVHRIHQTHFRASSYTQSSLRRPSWTELDYSAKPPTLGVKGSRTTPNTSSRVADGSPTAGISKVHVNVSVNVSIHHARPPSFYYESPSSSVAAFTTSPLSATSSAKSPVRRGSFDVPYGFRLRSRSDQDTGSRAESIRAARRKFEERERLREEKYEHEQMRKRERRDTKEASRIEREARKSESTLRTSMSRRSTPTGWAVRASTSRGRSSTRQELSFAAAVAEKQVNFVSRDYESVAGRELPEVDGGGADEVDFQHGRPRKTSGTKRKTPHGVWQGFLLWLRTKLLRLGAR